MNRAKSIDKNRVAKKAAAKVFASDFSLIEASMRKSEGTYISM